MPCADPGTRAEVAGRGEVLTGPLTIGCYPSLGPTALPRLLAGFQQPHPGVVVDFREDTQEALCRRLTDGELDRVITHDLDLPAGLARTEIAARQPYVLLADDHPLASGEQDAGLKLTALCAEPMVLLDAPPSSFHALRTCADAEWSPR